jgi:hypothetical protein
MIGFHFDARSNGLLKELEFFRMKYDNQQNLLMSFRTPLYIHLDGPQARPKGMKVLIIMSGD